MKYQAHIESQRAAAREYLEKLLSREAGVVEVKAVRKVRSNPQNAYLHACIGELSDYTGDTFDEMKETVKRECGLAYQKDDGRWFVKRTRELNTAEFARLIDNMLDWAAKVVGLPLPTPEEYNENWAYFDNKKETRKHAGIVDNQEN